jgi:hypothetical protein
MGNDNENRPDKPTEREASNRVLGLGSYAVGLGILVFVGYSIFDSPAAAMKDWKSLGMGVLFALVCLAIGYTTEGKRLK